MFNVLVEFWGFNHVNYGNLIVNIEEGQEFVVKTPSCLESDLLQQLPLM
jgi:hypothetical protein